MTGRNDRYPEQMEREPALRSALVVTSGEADAGRVDALPGPGPTTIELCRLLRDQAQGGFRVSTLIAPTEPVWRQELGRFFADRGVEDDVLVYLGCPLYVDEQGELHLHTSRYGGGAGGAGLPLRLLEGELARCRSRRVTVAIDRPRAAWGPAITTQLGAADLLRTRLAALAVAVTLRSTDAVVSELRHNARATPPIDLAMPMMSAPLRTPVPAARPARWRHGVSAAGPLLLAAAVAALASGRSVAGVGLSCAAVVCTIGAMLGRPGPRRARRGPRSGAGRAGRRYPVL